MNILETKKILQLADERDKNERGGEKI